MSNSAKWNQTLKICGITKLKSDIIFLSDVRISNKSLVSSENDIKNNFLHNPYERYNCSFNSTKNKRGVGILTKYDLQIEIVSEKRSEDENFLLQHIRIAGTELIIGSIYGPNNLDLEFFAALEDALSNYDTGNIPVILGGDFNCTYSCDPVPENIDCLNMARPPNISHSKKIADICDRFNLTDLYRYFNPELQEFTYTPRSETLKNKSRIDFFLVSDMLMNAVDNCKISQNVQNKLFDHKAISLSINEKIKPGIVRPTISNKDLNDDLLEFVVKTTVSETYLQHCTDNSLYGVNKNFLLNT
jgi:exonuclease III